MSEQTSQSITSLPRPSIGEHKAWPEYWRQMGQPWRTEPEIDVEQQKYLAERRRIIANIEQGIYPFKDIKLSRADVEWLLATHNDGEGPVNWSDEGQRERVGLDLRGANLQLADLRYLPLAGMLGGLHPPEWMRAREEHKEERQEMATVHLEGANLMFAHLEGSMLESAHLEGVILVEVHLEGAHLYRARLEGKQLSAEDVERLGVDLSAKHLKQLEIKLEKNSPIKLLPADMRGAFFDHNTRLDRITVYSEIDCFEIDKERLNIHPKKRIGVRLGGVHWNGVNLASSIEWSSIDMLRDEYEARRRKTPDGAEKDKEYRLREYQRATQANHEFETVLRSQGLNQEAARFSYRGQVLEQEVLRRKGIFREYLFSRFLDIVAGYGYKPERCLFLYLVALVVFTVAHYLLGVETGSHLTLLNALAVSVQSLHGRIFSFQSGDPQTVLNTIEAFVGLFIEAIIVAVITQRILGK